MTKKVLAIDFGASSGRAMVAELSDGRIIMQEIHRFTNDPVLVHGTMYWDVLRLYHEIKQSLIKAKPYDVESVSIDTWGVDFGLLDKEGRLLENPIHYRDARTHGMIERSSQWIDQERLYERTGNQLMEINTAFQLLSLKEQRPDLLERSERLLMMPDLFHYLLSGKCCAECSIASTTQLFDQRKQDWAQDVISALGLSRHLFADVVPSGTRVGTLSEILCAELDISPIQVIATCGHDTQCAMAAVPTQKEEFAFLSCGTWSLLGCELTQPMINEASKHGNITNEQGYGGKTSFLKNIVGLWLLQESRRQWMREGKEYSFVQLGKMAAEAKGFQCFVDPDDPIFTPAGNLPKRIQEYCARSHQTIPQSVGEITRCIYDSLALKYKQTLRELENCIGRKFDVLHMIGGGIQDQFLMAMCADACGIPVVCGPIEATALGNVVIQMITQGIIHDLKEARALIERSEPLRRYEPRDPAQWDMIERVYREMQLKIK